MPYKNIEDRKVAVRRYYQSHKKEAYEQHKKYREEHREEINRKAREYGIKWRAIRRKPKIIPDYSNGKLCPGCKTKKPYEEFFTSTKKRYYRCLGCRRKNWKEYAAKAGYYEKHRIYMKRTEAKNPGKYKEYKHQYYLRNKGKIKARAKEWHKRNYVKKGRPKLPHQEIYDALPNWYLKKSRLLAGTILTPEDIPTELVEAYKLYLKLKRAKQLTFNKRNLK